MAKPAVVSVTGAAALRRDLRRMGEEGGAILDQIKLAGKTAAEPVAIKARAAWPRSDLAHPHHADSIRVVATRTGATIREGGAAYGGTGWLEFGGGDADREYVSGGRWLFPAAVTLSSIVADMYARGIQKALDASSSWTNTTTVAAEVSE